MKIVNIFFASASDSRELLTIAHDEINTIKRIIPSDIQLVLKDWKNCTVSAMGNPEEEILKQMPLDSFNYFVGVFRFKYGEPTGHINPKTNTPFKSGLEEEFIKAYRLWEQRGIPDIMIFKSEEPVPREYCDEIKEIERFFDEFKHNGEHRGLYNTFSSPSDFAIKFRMNLLHRIIRLLSESNSYERKKYVGKVKRGFIDIFIDGESDQRNAVKQKEIRSTKLMRLQANSGYSFIGMGGIHNPFVRQSLEAGMKFHIIMQNPWSANALYLALTSKDFASKQEYNRYIKHQLPADDIIEIYKNSQWRNNRFQLCMNSYQSLRREYNNRIELRVSDRDLSTSILLTDNFVMVEPYCQTVNAANRSIPLFEVQMSKDSLVYKDLDLHFEEMWRSAYRYSTFKKNEQFFINRLKNYITQM